MTLDIKRLPAQLGTLRMALIIGALIAALAAAFAGEEAARSGWNMIPTLVFPAITPLIFMVLLLDALMSRVWSSDAEGAERVRLRTIMKIDLLAAGLLLLAWLPFFLTLGNR